ncbi:hypothetical protein GCM10010112_13060 [Actinoplanes lobatus]|uniref:YcxB-like protein domain-containing protein n=1 Tax=Actinoplanes lobatus TaxID=113568 RepID=A0A7W7HM81_9ACTN|nr:YcxB family protein [Actinoplanes lobatus]MBB4753144.1 hypothetical protein [Actinoplanes lobatus]GGN58863.1 hypothetical protein GCM10010112_13060 [Actinoplanes lobatus]GIE42996.1 hypothetical protein Alo02nite_58940 [Actinoplanes lobatus]
MEDAGQLTFQTRPDPKLAEALLRHNLFPIVAGLAAVTLAIAALLYQAGNPDGWGLSLLVSGVVGPLYMLFAIPRQVVRREAHKIGGPATVRIDAVGLHTTDGSSTDTLPWSAIKTVRRTRGQVLLLHRGFSGAKRRMSGIPTADLTPAEQARLLAVLHSRGAALTKAPTL